MISERQRQEKAAMLSPLSVQTGLPIYLRGAHSARAAPISTLSTSYSLDSLDSDEEESLRTSREPLVRVSHSRQFDRSNYSM